MLFALLSLSALMLALQLNRLTLLYAVAGAFIAVTYPFVKRFLSVPQMYLGLAFGAGLPVVPVSDLRALAQRVLGADPDVARVLACTDARMREVYWGCFERREGLAAPLGEERVSRPDAVMLPAAWSHQVQASARSAAQSREAALRLAGERVCGAGRGFAAYPQLRAALQSALDSLREELLPGAAEIALLAAPEVAGGRVFPPEQALPVYLRDDIARVSGQQSLN